MITVPRKDGGLQPVAPLPGARVNPSAPTSAFQPPASVDLTGLTRGVQQLAEKEKGKADQLAVLDADNQLAQLQTDLATKATSLRGKDALGAQADVTDQWKQGVDKIRSNLTNDRQQLAFDGRASGRYQSLYETVARHTQGEVRAYDDQTTQAALDNRLNDALTNYHDPAQLAQALGETKAIVADYGRRNGWSSDVVQQKTADRVSKLHAGVIDRMLANDEDLGASKYYADVKDQIAGTDAAPLEKALEEGSLRGESQRQADAIVAGNPTRTAAMDAIRKITDPKVRDAVETRINQHFGEKDAADRDAREANMLTATNLVDKTASIYSIPPALWTNFTLGERASLKEYAKQKVTGDPIKTDWTSYYDLLSLASSDATKDQFLSKNLMQYRGKLADTEFKQVAELQSSLRRGDGKAESQLVGIRTAQQIVGQTLKQVGINPNPKPGSDDADRVSLFSRAVDEQGLIFEQEHKRKPNSKELQSIVDDLVVRGTIAGSGWFGTNFLADKKREFERVPGEGDFIIDAGDVPQGERAKIADALRRAKQPVTDANVLRLYQQKLSTLVPLASQ